jgi:hypothetical protein
MRRSKESLPPLQALPAPSQLYDLVRLLGQSAARQWIKEGLSARDRDVAENALAPCKHRKISRS